MSFKTIHIEEAIQQKLSFQWIDVRSESEYQKAHIPGAINIPLLSNEHRVLIGTCYKQHGREAAVELGLELIGPKMLELFRKYKQAEVEGKKLLFYCWRGGLRSQISTTIYSWAGQKPTLLVGGYKSFRSFIHSQFEKPLNLKVIGGSTGSGKTEILHLLQKKGEQIIDLEGLALHKGSAFGGLGFPPQPSTESFENSIGLIIFGFDLSKKIFVENESRLTGHCFLPLGFWNQMQSAPIIEVEVDKETRIKRLVKEYAHFDIELLKEKTNILRKKLGGQHANEAIEHLESKRFELWIDKLLVYYDKTYGYSVEKNTARLKTIEFNWRLVDESIDKITQL
jgi:tRNA 2-selenouridine synthase